MAILGLWLVALALLAYVSLRWTRIDPQFPESRSGLWTVVIAVASAALILLAFPGPKVSPLAAALAIGLVTGPAIIPPVNISKAEDSSFLSRKWKELTSMALGGVAKTAVIAVFLFLAPALDILPVDHELPLWLFALALTCAFSILTRPISIPVDPRRINRLRVGQVDTSPRVVKQRFAALAALIVWLVLALPALEASYDPDASLVQLSLAVFVGTSLSDYL